MTMYIQRFKKQAYYKVTMVSVSIFFIKIYQKIFSPTTGLLVPSPVRVCRFFPSCSDYAVEALEKHGFWRGWMFSLFRICRCNPFMEGGCDPVKK